MIPLVLWKCRNNERRWHGETVRVGIRVNFRSRVPTSGWVHTLRLNLLHQSYLETWDDEGLTSPALVSMSQTGTNHSGKAAATGIHLPTINQLFQEMSWNISGDIYPIITKLQPGDAWLSLPWIKTNGWPHSVWTGWTFWISIHAVCKRENGIITWSRFHV